MSTVERLTIVFLCPCDIGKTGQRLAHHVVHLVFLGYIVSTMDEIECFVECPLVDISYLCSKGTCIVEQDDVIVLIVRMLLIYGQSLLHQSQGLFRVALRQSLCQALVCNIIGMPILRCFSQLNGLS